MPQIRPIPAVVFARTLKPLSGNAQWNDVSSLIGPPFDVQDDKSKAALLARDGHNIVTIDLPHLPAKSVGPPEAYRRAGETYREWLKSGVLARRDTPALFVYQQTYTWAGVTHQRRGVFAAVSIQPFGPAPAGSPPHTGGIYPHELTFKEGTIDRMNLMRTTRAQMSPVFGMYRERTAVVRSLMQAVIAKRPANYFGRTMHDDTLHEVWTVDDVHELSALANALTGIDLFIADGHHRYTTALNYKSELEEKQGPLPKDHPANFALFVLVAGDDPGMVILPTHRVLGNMPGFTFNKFAASAAGLLRIEPFGGDLTALEKALPTAGPHAMGLYDPATKNLHIATTVDADPLLETHPKQSTAWRQLDVAVVQHLLVERICEGDLVPAGQKVKWKFPHTHEEFLADSHQPGMALGIFVQATPLSSVMDVSLANELMPQKSTFFYPKLATGLVMNPLE